MSYTNYNQGGGYSQPNPYDQRFNDNPYQAQGTYSAGSYNDGGYQLRNDVEMQPLNGGYQDGYNRPANSVPLYQRCKEISDQIDSDLVPQMRDLEAKYISAIADPGRNRAGVDAMHATFMATHKDLVQQLTQVKRTPGASDQRNEPQIRKTENKLQQIKQEKMNADRNYREKTKEQAERQMRIVNPNMSDADVEKALNDDPNTEGVFRQALLQSNRVGQATSTLNNVKQRHEDIQKIEREMTELFSLFQDLEQAVETQAPKIAAIEQTTVEAHDNVVKGNTEIDGAIDKARSARRKKWWCLLIVVIILIIIAIIVAIVVTQLNK